MKSITIRELKNIASIEEIIGKYLNIKSSGNTYKALCPFHKEKTPSFIINPEKKFYHCFGCGEHGDIFSFLVKYRNINFKDAVKEVADFYGYEIKSEYYNVKKDKSQHDILIKLNNIALQKYRYILKDPIQGKTAREYIKNRNINEELIELFSIGYAPDEWDTITKLLERNDIDKNIKKKSDLIKINNKYNRTYDRFRHRVIFPIFNESDEVLGFGGRSLGIGKTTGKEPAKYLNSSENEIFKKRNILYNLNLAKNEIKEKKTVIITEGYIDVIVCYQFGFKNVVAPMGTAITFNQIKKLEKISEKIILLFDGDKAGLRATLKSIDLIFQTNMDVMVVRLPNDLDPSDYLFKHGKDNLKNLLRNAENGLDFKLNYISKVNNMETPKGKENFIKQAIHFISNTGNRILFDIALKKISQTSKIPEYTIRKVFTKSNSNQNNISKYQKEENNEDLLIKIQNNIINILLANPNDIENIIIKLPDNLFTNNIQKKVYNLIKDIIMKEGYVNYEMIYNYLDDEEIQQYDKIIKSINEYSADTEITKQMIIEHINKLKLLNIEKRIEENDINTKQASDAGNLVLLTHYMEERQYLLNERAKLNKYKYNKPKND